MRKSVAVAAAVVLALAGGFACAAVRDGGTTIHACALEQNGQLRLDTGNGCLPSEQPVEWSQAGPQGPPGNTDSAVRFASGFIVEDATASAAVLSGTGRLGTLTFTCSGLTYVTSAGDAIRSRIASTSTRPGRRLAVPGARAPGRVGGRERPLVPAATGYVENFPEFSGCSYDAHVSTADVRS